MALSQILESMWYMVGIQMLVCEWTGASAHLPRLEST